MKTFAVRVEGTGIQLAVQEGHDAAIGFFTTRWVKASSQSGAHKAATQAILADWVGNGEYAGANTGSPPQLVVEEVWVVGTLRALFSRRPAGYSFYRSQ